MSEITCPSGLKVEVRGLKGKELKIFQDKSKVGKDGAAVLDRILDACVERVIDPGLYTLNDEGKLSWSDVLLGDEFFLFVEIRKQTFGNTYAFRARCPVNDCKHKFEWELDLSELPVMPLPASTVEALRTGTPLETKLPDGRAVKFRLLTGKDEREVMKLTGAENPMISMLAHCIVSLGGETDKTKIRRELEETGLGELMKMRKLFDKSDCGIDTTITIKCPAPERGPDGELPERHGCGEESDVTLPLGRTFLTVA
jgi:hypothetical protein